MTLLASLLGPLQLLLGVLLLGLSAWRGAGSFPHTRRSTAERLLVAIVVATWLAVVSVAALGALGWLRAELLLACASLAWLASRRLPAPPPLAWSWRRLRVFWPLALPLALLAVDGVVLLGLAPDQWDAMTYHLYFPLRWLQEGQLFQVPSFADETILYAPQNGALFFAWQMALLGSDATTDVCQLVLLGALMLAGYRLALLAGWRRRAASCAAGFLPLLKPFHSWALTAQVDIFMTAFLVLGAVWLTGGLARREGRQLALAGLALGLALGSKTVAIPLVALFLAPALGVLAWRRQWRAALATIGGVLLGGGFWLAAYLALYGNPLFPLDFSVGIWHFEGIYDRASLAASPFRVRELGPWVSAILAKDGLLPWLLATLGALGWLVAARRRPWPAFAVALSVLATALYVFALVPHNNQSRFLLPALAFALPGLAAIGSWRGPRTLRRLPLAIAVTFWLQLACLLLLAPWQPWRRALAIWRAVDAGDGLWATPALAALGIGLGGLVAFRRLPTWRVAAAVLAAVWLTGALTMSVARAEASRPLVLASAPYGKLAPGFLPFQRPELPPQRIAYAGFNLPYTLAGPRLRHTVLYCNVHGEPGDGVFEFWDRDRGQRRVGLYREQADVDTWLACLEARQIDYVVISMILEAERNPRWSYDGRFPIERAWARTRPELFEPLVVHDLIEVYRRRP
jgi:hypothetical protein